MLVSFQKKRTASGSAYSMPKSIYKINAFCVYVWIASNLKDSVKINQAEVFWRIS